MDSFLLALQFLTRIPVKRRIVANDAVLGCSVLYYPLIGLLIGVVLAVSALLLANSPALVGGAVLLAVWVGLTGGLHLDGLADCADAWVGGLANKQRSLDIMKDPLSGPIAVLVLVLLLLAKWAAVTVLLQQGHFIDLMMTPVLGRIGILLLMLSTPYVRPQGLGAQLVEHLPVVDARRVVLISLFFSGLFLGWATVLLVGLVMLWIRQAAVERLGGATGDVYGAAVELVETATLLLLVLL